MNKHGQTLILFVVLIPIIVMLLAIIVDVSLISSKKMRFEEVTKYVMKSGYNLDDEKMKEFFKKNDLAIDNLIIVRENAKLTIENAQEVKSIFGGIVGIKKYNIKVKVTGYLKDDKVIFE